ncbi:uncharacterized protein C8Q71DRAFT_705647 [Rhodofomes roseus]|uniref:Reverse transcriptase zinc-binding domain-containing protein n=1 Tax=Rhodofomes roseus TaxID=34475 RepID=A0ABQ8KKH0_9APHY|nr:uncharacterized protein C8Q71DRAFT_705647 [Rhodofomes roseus]KAH9838423.1 hypothetical protein C8Q71DRAFT_705647 [Rhodofomes roseus]
MREPKAQAAFFGKDDPRNAIIPMMRDPTSRAEIPGTLVAMLYVAQVTPPDAPLHLVLEDDLPLTFLFEKLAVWEDKGWIDVPFKTLLIPLVGTLRHRCAATTLRKAVKETDRRAMGVARDLASSDPPQGFQPTPAPSMDGYPHLAVSGVRLQVLTQALAYRGIRLQREPQRRRRTEQNIDAARTHLESNQPAIPDDTLWKSQRNPDFSRPFAVLLWKSMHDALRCGSYWLNITGYEYRATCSYCGATEDLSHILWHCPATGQSAIWAIVSMLWTGKGLKWSGLSKAELHTLGLTVWKDNKGRVRTGATRLWRILVSEATHLIWKLRCERVIGHADYDGWDHDETYVRNRLYTALNRRLSHDVEATRKRYADLAIPKQTVLDTWSGLLHDELALPLDWTTCTGFLVGSAIRILRDTDPG